MRPSWIRSAAIILSVLGGAGLAPEGALAAAGKVTVCHVPPGNPRNAHTIEISNNAVSAHLAHGDQLGECLPQVCTPGATASCYGGPGGTAGVGVCLEGTQTCNADGSAFGPCVGQVLPGTEACGDGLDNDCDGVADDGCVCVPSSTAPCYDGPPGTAGVGSCQAGTTTCLADGTGYGECVGDVVPSAEACGNGLDDDCDGQSDEGCVCAPGATASCYTGPAGTAGVGVCAPGTQTCNAAGTGYGSCVGDVTPGTEACGNGLDDDCDGQSDEGCVCAPGAAASCYNGPAGTAGVGVCAAGIQTCNAAGTGYGACVGEIQPSAEVCGDALDNDCDGQSDEGCVCTPASTAACYSGPPSTEDVGTCASGTKICNAAGTGYGACVGEILPSTEACGDGLDNDCDGLIDDGCVCTPLSSVACYGGPPGTAGVGVCVAGTQTCNVTGTGYGACTGDVVPSAEACGDGLDNDCDGFSDEGCVGDRAWQDLDGDGVQDAGEPGLAGAIFIVRTTAGAVVAIAVSDVNGTYHFSGIPTGSYYVEIVSPSGFQPTVPDAGGDDTLDSDFDQTALTTAPFTVVSNGTKLDLDCGFVVGTP